MNSKIAALTAKVERADKKVAELEARNGKSEASKRELQNATLVAGIAAKELEDAYNDLHKEESE